MPTVPNNTLGITLDEFKGFELAGIRLHDQTGKLIDDAELNRLLTEAEKWFEEKIGMKFYKKSEHPDGLLFANVDHNDPSPPSPDVEIDKLDYDGLHFAENRYMMVVVPWGPVLDIERIFLGYPGNISGFEITKDRIQWRGQFRNIQVIPVLVGSVGTTLAFPTGFYPFGSVPHSISVNYRGGMSDEKVCAQYPHILRMIKTKAAIQVLNVAQNLTDPGVSSRGVSADGLSQNTSFTQSAVYGLYSATIDKFEKILDKDLQEFDQFWNGVNTIFVA